MNLSVKRPGLAVVLLLLTSLGIQEAQAQGWGSRRGRNDIKRFFEQRDRRPSRSEPSRADAGQPEQKKPGYKHFDNASNSKKSEGMASSDDRPSNWNEDRRPSRGAAPYPVYTETYMGSAPLPLVDTVEAPGTVFGELSESEKRRLELRRRKREKYLAELRARQQEAAEQNGQYYSPE